MFLIVGLGNYPKEYELTRHNIGFMCLDNIAEKYGMTFKSEAKFKADVASISYNNEKVMLVKPLTYMNLSGEAVQKITTFYKIEPKNILVVFDDISLELGKFRFRANGTDGGHNGIKSIITNLSTKDFPRLKIGIGTQQQFMKSEKFVLQNFPKEQMPLLNNVVVKSVDAVEDYLKFGINEAQNIYNGVNLSII